MLDISGNGVLTGLSDHTLGIVTSVAAVSLGASVIEKHLTLDRSDGDLILFSLEPRIFSHAKLLRMLKPWFNCVWR